MKEQEVRKILEEVTDELVRREVDLWPRIEQRIKARRHLRLRPSEPLPSRRIGMGAIAATTLLVVGLLLIWRAAPASAAEVLRRAESAWASQTAAGDIVLERFFVASRTGEPGLVAEIWRSTDGSRLRYQVLDEEGRLVFLALRSGDEIWRSLHNEPPGTVPVGVLLHTSPGQLEQILGQRGTASPLFRSAIYGLADLESLLVQGRQACPDLLCLLGVLDLEDERVRVIGRVRTDEGRQVYVIGILDRSPADQSWDEARHIRIDAESYALVDYEDAQGSVVRLLERRGISASDVAEGFFRAIPEAVRVVEVPAGWRPPSSAEGGEADRVWIVSASPDPNVELTGAERFAVTVGYELVSAPVANLYASLMPACLMEPGTGCAGAVVGAGQVIVAAGMGEETLEFALELWNLQGEVVLAAYLDTGGEVELFRGYTWVSEAP